MTDERAPGIPPAATLEELGARLWVHDRDPDLFQRRILVLTEIAYALQGTSPTITQLLGEAMDAERKHRIGPAARPVAEVFPLIAAAAIVTILVGDKDIPASVAYPAVAKSMGVDKAKLKAFRENLQRGRQGPDLLASYEAHLNELRTALLPR